MNEAEFFLTLTEDDTFDQSECDMVVEKFLCGVCHGPLNVVYIPNDRRVLVVCIEHGNVCQCGRVTVATAAIELERSYKKFYSAIRALSDLWGSLVDEGFAFDHSKRIIHEYVCEVCGGQLTPTLRTDKNVNISCQSHGDINLCGYVKKSIFKYDFQRIRVWNQSHRKEYSHAN